MSNRKWIGWILMIAVLVGFCAFQIHPPRKIGLNIPKGWPQPETNWFATNPVTEEGFQLGRKLFYDGRLSKDGNFPCAGCHQQFAAFSTFDHDLSHGFNNALTTRNAPVLQNLIWMPAFHWDGGVNHLEVQPLSPITSPGEMAESLPSVISKLKADPKYRTMFRSAFNSDSITSQRMLQALAQFMGSLISSQSKYDAVKAGKAQFSISEAAGYQVFLQHCNRCHTEPLFTNNSFQNTGLQPSSRLYDIGRARITSIPSDSFKFKVPSLRNSTVSAPYMHDGRFATLSQVLNHYRKGMVHPGVSVDSLIAAGLPITPQQQLDLFSFLYTLKDDTFLKNPRFGPPPAEKSRSQQQPASHNYH